jgi:glycosyltransferase involved in cell wall biosynthesis
MNKFSVVIPLLNEIDEKKRFKKLIHQFEDHQLIFCDAGSSDGTFEELQDLQREFPNIRVIQENLESPSVLKTIEIAYPYIKRPHTLIHPVDLDLNKNLEVVELLELGAVQAFYKSYAPTNWLLRLQSFFLNRVDLKVRQNFVWTNAPLIQSEVLKEFRPKAYGFLEDVQLSDALKVNYNIKPIEFPIIVSSRRYMHKGTIRRFIKNALIILMYRSRLLSIKKLKMIYET